jgi:hypothetical protein
MRFALDEHHPRLDRLGAGAVDQARGAQDRGRR